MPRPKPKTGGSRSTQTRYTPAAVVLSIALVLMLRYLTSTLTKNPFGKVEIGPCLSGPTDAVRQADTVLADRGLEARRRLRRGEDRVVDACSVIGTNLAFRVEMIWRRQLRGQHPGRCRLADAAGRFRKAGHAVFGRGGNKLEPDMVRRPTGQVEFRHNRIVDQDPLGRKRKRNPYGALVRRDHDRKGTKQQIFLLGQCRCSDLQCCQRHEGCRCSSPFQDHFSLALEQVPVPRGAGRSGH